MAGQGVPQSDRNSRWPAVIGFSLLGLMVLGLISLAWWSFAPQKAILIPPAPAADDKARQRALTLIPTTQSLVASASQVPNPVTIAPSAAGSILVPGVDPGDVLPPGIAAPVSLGGSTLTIAPQGSADPLQFALHPSHFTDLTRISIPGPIVISADPLDSNALTKAVGNQPDPYQEAVRLEKARQFVTSMCTDLQGNVWIATEGGGVQKFDPTKPALEAFSQYTTKNGLADDFCTAIACDTVGRIWVGTAKSGLSVFTGKACCTFEVVGGLTSPNTLSGPLAEHISHIAVNPKDGDIWLVTSCGLSRYSQSNTDHN
jgi:hypothetical protein